MMRSVFHRHQLLLLVLICLVSRQRQSANAFTLFSPSTHGTQSSTSSVLNAKKMKKGMLSEIADAGSVPKTTTPKRSSKKKKSTSSDATISPDLANWMAQKQQQQSGSVDESTATSTTDDDASDETDDVSFEQFVEAVVEETSPTTKKSKKGKNDRRQKQSMKKEEEAARSAELDDVLKTLEVTLEEQAGNIDEILSVVQQLLQIDSTTSPKQLFGSKNKVDYRLAWVGSDDAICHVGTGLHKVPLARLQEVFLTAEGRSRISILEIIRILGPFPNVKNMLQGTVKVGSSDKMQIVMDSMVDGTGKEILAGTEDNVRRVDLQIAFCDERVVVAVVPNENGSSRTNPLEEKGENVLVFVREEKLDEKLDALRVS